MRYCSKLLTALMSCAVASGLTSCREDISVSLDGSSTVFLISEAVAEEFGKLHPRVRVTVGKSGTGGGFKKFCTGTTMINDASRPIKQKEADLAKQNKIDFIELPVAYDGLTVVVNKGNDFCDSLTTEELKRIWEPGSKVNNWKQVRPGFPDLKLELFGAGVDSGTFDYFTGAINGKERACRTDYTASEDDNTLVSGVAGNRGAMGFFGFAYYHENTATLRAVAISYRGAKAIAPTVDTIRDGTYAPLSRPIFIYVSTAAIQTPQVQTFVEFYLAQAAKLSRDVGYVRLPEPVYQAARERFAKRVTGSVFLGKKNTAGIPLETLYGK
ncbi:MAG: PstS family phosphate ABC transporter substrate-binding protein [Planctomycetes bacterium]|nr:PstS family phosphate ABC transporter substrate-binding protein [Planctomycetota bacterium]MCB9869195.1 PstS family phosphate ABC transporter substrate-binding protein [Planctomycetota bacterium]